MEILINYETNFEMTNVQSKLLENVIRNAVKNENIRENLEVSVLFVDNEQMRRINKKFRKLDKPTDVLSFPQLSGPVFKLDNAPTVLGDIVISVEKAREQAEEYGRAFEREFGFLAAHGILHLLGYDHIDEASEKIMFAKQEEILNECGLGHC